jgi:hypothetical protein
MKGINMGMTCEGTIGIPLVEFWEFVAQQDHGVKSAQVSYGVPRVSADGDRLEIDFAASTEGHPFEWVKKPEAKLQWDEFKLRRTEIAGLLDRVEKRRLELEISDKELLDFLIQELKSLK